LTASTLPQWVVGVHLLLQRNSLVAPHTPARHCGIGGNVWSPLESRARLFGHSLHQILIVFPLGLFNTSVGFDMVRLITRKAHWSEMAYYIIVAGLLGGVAAVVAGCMDYWGVPPGTRAKRIARMHGVGSTMVMLLFAGSAYVRSDDPLAFKPVAFGLSLAGVALMGIVGWLGGELVTRMGVGVADDAGLNAPGTQIWTGASSRNVQ